MIMVINPMPPICIISKMTSWPKTDQCENVSNTTRPVTQVALVAVKKASTNPVHSPDEEERGRHNRKEPDSITKRKLNAISLVVLIDLKYFIIMKEILCLLFLPHILC